VKIRQADGLVQISHICCCMLLSHSFHFEGDSERERILPEITAKFRAPPWMNRSRSEGPKYPSEAQFDYSACAASSPWDLSFGGTFHLNTPHFASAARISIN
jgi:hypothetical protein